MIPPKTEEKKEGEKKEREREREKEERKFSHQGRCLRPVESVTNYRHTQLKEQL